MAYLLDEVLTTDHLLPSTRAIIRANDSLVQHCDIQAHAKKELAFASPFAAAAHNLSIQIDPGRVGLRYY